MLLFLQILIRSTFISHLNFQRNFHFHYSKKHRIKYFNKPVQLKRTESPIQKLNRKQESPVSLPSSPLTERERETFKIIDNRVWSINWQAHFTRYSIQSMAARRSGRISLTYSRFPYEKERPLLSPLNTNVVHDLAAHFLAMIPARFRRSTYIYI